jgi:outer membrane receptor protein involved in Fe transport
MAGAAYLAPAPESSYSYWGSFETLDSGRTYHSNFFHLPNPKLEPMISKNIELSLNQYIGTDFNATLLAYYSHATNLLQYGTDEGNTNLYGGKFMGWNVDYIETFVNGGTENSMGATLQLTYHNNFHKGSVQAHSYLSYLTGMESLFETDENGLEHSKQVEAGYISHFMLKTGADVAFSKFSFSPRLVWVSHQHLDGFIDPANPYKRQTIPGYKLLNIAVAYKLGQVSFFANVINALNSKYRSVGPNMDLQNKNTELFYGDHQDPIRFNGGMRFIF